MKPGDYYIYDGRLLQMTSYRRGGARDGAQIYLYTVRGKTDTLNWWCRRSHTTYHEHAGTFPPAQKIPSGALAAHTLLKKMSSTVYKPYSPLIFFRIAEALNNSHPLNSPPPPFLELPTCLFVFRTRTQWLELLTGRGRRGFHGEFVVGRVRLPSMNRLDREYRRSLLFVSNRAFVIVNIILRSGRPCKTGRLFYYNITGKYILE